MAIGEFDFPLTVDGQYQLAMTVTCSFCKKEIGERCVPGLIFPQYPHTPRIQDALVAKGHTREEVLALYSFEEKKK